MFLNIGQRNFIFTARQRSLSPHRLSGSFDDERLYSITLFSLVILFYRLFKKMGKPDKVFVSPILFVSGELKALPDHF
jgi:hypothetical protein